MISEKIRNILRQNPRLTPALVARLLDDPNVKLATVRSLVKRVRQELQSPPNKSKRIRALLDLGYEKPAEIRDRLLQDGIIVSTDTIKAVRKSWRKNGQVQGRDKQLVAAWQALRRKGIVVSLENLSTIRLELGFRAPLFFDSLVSPKPMIWAAHDGTDLSCRMTCLAPAQIPMRLIGRPGVYYGDNLDEVARERQRDSAFDYLTASPIDLDLRRAEYPAPNHHDEVDEEERPEVGQMPAT